MDQNTFENERKNETSGLIFKHCVEPETPSQKFEFECSSHTVAVTSLSGNDVVTITFSVDPLLAC